MAVLPQVRSLFWGVSRKVLHGNGGKVHTERDSFKRVTGIRYDNEPTPRYTTHYDANGRVARVEDKALGRWIATELDAFGRPMRVTQMEGTSHLYTKQCIYDATCDRVWYTNEWVGPARTRYSSHFYYNEENRLTRLVTSAGETVTYGIDGLGRCHSRSVFSSSGSSYVSNYAYLAGGQGTNSSTALVSSIAQNGQVFSYAYDNVGNITSETRNSVATTYVYDKLGQLVRVNDPYQSKSFTYAYDRGGNILARQEYAYTTGTLGAAVVTVPYTYGDSNWKDKLTAYNGVEIVYDQIGNPLNDGTWSYTWQAGRQLAQVAKVTGETVKFTYDASGLRVRKESSAGVTKYTLSGKNVVHMTRSGGTGGTVDMHFWYDAQGKPVMVRYNGRDYYYVYNAQGDVVALLDRMNNNTQVVEYRYDAWGKQVGCTGTLASTLGKDNPFRYRGYVYDEETGLYSLPARFYNPEWERWINADALLMRNLFVYCNNNPVNMSDPSGCSSVELLTTKEAFDHNGGKPGVHVQGTGQLTDLLTGITFKIGWGNIPDKYHTDWSPLTVDDTNIIKRILHPGVSFDDIRWKDQTFWSWGARPAILTMADGSRIAVGIHFAPHFSTMKGTRSGFPDSGTDDPNVLGGHMCMYFPDSTGNDDGKPGANTTDYQAAAFSASLSSKGVHLGKDGESAWNSKTGNYDMIN